MEGWIALGLGVLFIALGAGAFLWGRQETEGYYAAIANKSDVREFLDALPFAPSRRR